MAVIDPKDPNYPRYVISFQGSLLDAETQPVRQTGPHTFVLRTPHANVKIELTRNPANTADNMPDLTINVTEV